MPCQQHAAGAADLVACRAGPPWTIRSQPASKKSGRNDNSQWILQVAFDSTMWIADVLFMWERRWSARPFVATPAKKSMILASSAALVWSIFSSLYFASVVASDRHFHAFLTVQYWLHLAISVAVLASSASTLAAVYHSPHGVAGSIRCPSSSSSSS
jgi:hypothetical protein